MKGRAIWNGLCAQALEDEGCVRVYEFFVPLIVHSFDEDVHTACGLRRVLRVQLFPKERDVTLQLFVAFQ